MRHAADSDIKGRNGFTAKAAPDDDAYKARVAEPVMGAVDALPADYRACVHEFGYVQVFLAWRRRWSVEAIRAHAAANGGRFEPWQT